MSTWEFPCSEPVDLRVGIASGTVAITAAPTDAATVRAHRGRSGAAATSSADDGQADDFIVDFTDGRLEISEPERHGLRWHAKDLHLRISVPDGSRCAVQAASADVTLQGEPGSLDVRTASGSVDAAAVRGPAEILTMSGDIRVRDVTGEATLHTASGRISVRHVEGDVTARTASGDVVIGTAGGSVTARSASGQVLVGGVTRGRTDVNTVSGDVEVKVVQGIGVYLDLASLTGRISSDLEPADEGGQENLQLHCRTVSGAIRVVRATAAEMAS
jgi:DUF4097 and DUF4098 domain-containing protein YvlB